MPNGPRLGPVVIVWPRLNTSMMRMRRRSKGCLRVGQMRVGAEEMQPSHTQKCAGGVFAGTFGFQAAQA